MSILKCPECGYSFTGNLFPPEFTPSRTVAVPVEDLELLLGTLEAIKAMEHDYGPGDLFAAMALTRKLLEGVE